MTTKTAIIVFPGSNCVDETQRLLLSIFETVPILVWHKEQELPDADFFVLPGGFSYGDYIRSGMMAAASPLMQHLRKASVEGKKILGICNGFQILCELDLLPGTLQLNESGRFICKPVTITHRGDTEEYVLPVAHGEGNYYVETPKDVKDAFVYTEDVNGSVDNIAGVYNADKNILGMMPHPERAFEKYHVSQDGPDSIWMLLA